MNHTMIARHEQWLRVKRELESSLQSESDKAAQLSQLSTEAAAATAASNAPQPGPGAGVTS